MTPSLSSRLYRTVPIFKAIKILFILIALQSHLKLEGPYVYELTDVNIMCFALVRPRRWTRCWRPITFLITSVPALYHRCIIAMHTRLSQYLLEVSEGVESIPGPGQSDTDPVVRLQKAHWPLLIAADQWQDDNVILLPLVVVHSRHSYTCNSDVIHMNTNLSSYSWLLRTKDRMMTSFPSPW